MAENAERNLREATATFQRDLLDWYQVQRRRLPWRERPSLYKTVISEFMLQQTQVKTVLPYFARWLQAFPDFATLAAAHEDQVLKLWEGLGYYSRARNLHRLARVVTQLPAAPQTPAEWRELPGIGPYTAAAITSISFGVPVACVDGNVVRILARLTANGTEYRDSASAARAFTPLADALVPPEAPGEHNQAMMELGATVCVRRKPLCTICPVRPLCAAARTGEPEAFPKLAAKTLEPRAVTRVWCERPGALLLHRAAAGSRRLANLYELPSLTDMGLAEVDVAGAPVLATRKRSITRFSITETIRRLDTAPARDEASVGLEWVEVGEVENLALSGPHRRWVTALLAAKPA